MSSSLTHAGAIAYRTRDGRLEFLFVSSSDGSNWVLPKGHIEAGESAEEAALRELREEAGVEGRIIRAASEAEYRKPKGKRVSVRYYLVCSTGSAPSREDRTVRWEEESSAVRLLSFPDAKDALRKAAEMVKGSGTA